MKMMGVLQRESIIKPKGILLLLLLLLLFIITVVAERVFSVMPSTGRHIGVAILRTPPHVISIWNC